MKSAMLYILGGLMLALVVSVAWWTRMVVEPTPHVMTQGETVVELVRDFGVSAEAIADANNVSISELQAFGTGDLVAIPRPAPSGIGVWKVHGFGLAAEILGVALSFWLALVAGLLPKGYRQQMLGISAALGLASYAGSHAVAGQAPVLTPEFLFSSIKDGFAWAAAFPLFASVFGVNKLSGDRAARRAEKADAKETGRSRDEPSLPPGGEDEMSADPAGE